MNKKHPSGLHVELIETQVTSLDTRCYKPSDQ